MALWLTPAQAEALVAQARAAAPRECCGLLAGHSAGHVGDIIAISNGAAAPEHAYRMDERELARALTRLPTRNLELLGLYHSHPQGGPRPSMLDVQEWAYPDSAMVIIGLRPETAITAWAVRYGEVTPVEVVISATPPEAPASLWTNAARAAVLVAVIAAVVLVLLIAFTLLPPAPQIPPTPMPR
jgi:proteasome lid subunit RPN8/RPN11